MPTQALRPELVVASYLGLRGKGSDNSVRGDRELPVMHEESI